MSNRCICPRGGVDALCRICNPRAWSMLTGAPAPRPAAVDVRPEMGESAPHIGTMNNIPRGGVYETGWIPLGTHQIMRGTPRGKKTPK